MKKQLGFLAAVFAFVGGLLVYNSAFILNQTEQALILQFGEPKRIIKEPGLTFKLPFIQDIVIYDNRLLELDPPVEEVILADQKRLKVDSFTRFKIVDPLLFYQSVATERSAISRLGDIINSSIREVLGNVLLSNLLSEDRAKIMDDISKIVANYAASFGVEVAKVRIKRADFPEQISQAIYKRMNSEREREAKEFRAKGQELAQEIVAKAEKEKVMILSKAQEQAQLTRGEGDQKAIDIWAKAAKQDESFYDFYRSLEAYRNALKKDGTSMVLSPDSEFFEYFKSLPKMK
ncbi:MAG: protease modulator HflC [Alphaproteobacteria bacterium]